MKERKLKNSEIEQLNKYISYCAEQISRIGKTNVNHRLASLDFLTPTISSVSVPLLSEAGEFLYYQKYIKTFSNLLGKGTITKKEVEWYHLNFSVGFVIG